jgi:hypothetical protein
MGGGEEMGEVVRHTRGVAGWREMDGAECRAQSTNKQHTHITQHAAYMCGWVIVQHSPFAAAFALGLPSAARVPSPCVSAARIAAALAVSSGFLLGAIAVQRAHREHTRGDEPAPAVDGRW